MFSNTIFMELLFSAGVPQGRLCLTPFSKLKNGIDRTDGLLNVMLYGMKFLKLKLEEREEMFWFGLVQKLVKSHTPMLGNSFEKKAPATGWTRELWNPIQPPRRSLLC
ncbi:hypothetical protein QJS04_geneDACA016793 [Acorus gramineus]|uniref:Uncharacterized protein n=1 Tax=Acorus gramineus TaxID=55184 RepID=A0AAV9BGV5_ACOGR|nr:hypothetical protein QJS04_geneDACA016793 [Acorus gramineus]